MNRETRDERLRRLLREADPAASHPGLSQDEIREMRRTVLTAIPQRRRLLPAFAWAGAAAAALILIAILLPRPVSEPAPAPPRIAAVPDRAVLPRTVQPPPPRKEPKPPAKKSEKRRAVHRQRRAPAARPAPAPAMPEAAVMLAAVEPPAEAQQIQFSTPGGTRIIWMLSPGKDSE